MHGLNCLISALFFGILQIEIARSLVVIIPIIIIIRIRIYDTNGNSSYIVSLSWDNKSNLRYREAAV